MNDQQPDAKPPMAQMPDAQPYGSGYGSGPAPAYSGGFSRPSIPFKPPTGRVSWALGFIACIPLPYVSMIVTAVVMMAVYPSAKRKPYPIAVENARRAANWGLTILTVMAVCAAYSVCAYALFPEFRRALFPIGFGPVGFLALGVVHLVLTIMGTVTAGRNRVFKNRLAIPYLRGSQQIRQAAELEESGGWGPPPPQPVEAQPPR